MITLWLFIKIKNDIRNVFLDFEQIPMELQNHLASIQAMMLLITMLIQLAITTIGLKNLR